MLLIYPPLAKACEAPAGIANLAGVLHGHGLACTLLDANLKGQLFLLGQHLSANDTWTKRAKKALPNNLTQLRDPEIYAHPARYQRAVADINRVLEQVGLTRQLNLNLANYQDSALSPLKSEDLVRSAGHPEDNIFYPWFAEHLPRLIEATNPKMVGLSLNYLSQAPTTFAMIGFLKRIAPGLPIVVGGGLITSWLRNPAWSNPFGGLIDHLISGPGEEPLLKLLGVENVIQHHPPRFQGLPVQEYLAPGFILPYAASSGCYWNRCSFCPEKAEDNPYHSLPAENVVNDLAILCRETKPAIIHFLDNAIAPSLMQQLIVTPPSASWYGFARVSRKLCDPQFCRELRQSGCLMLKLGIESGDQNVLDAMDKGIDLQMVAQTLTALEQAGIATYVYLLFGTPSEGLAQARKTLDFVVAHHHCITFLNLAVFNMPVCSPEAEELQVQQFYEGDLSLYSDFIHPQGWGRKEIRTFLDKEFKRHPAIIPILQRDPPVFTSNHAPFFAKSTPTQQEEK